MKVNRLHRLVGAGLVDSFGLALGWTVFVLYALETQGLGAVGIYSAAMLVGVGISAPAAGWLAARLNGRRLLQSTAVVEAALRVGSFALLLAGAPVAAVAAAVVLTNVVAWTGYAGMRAEVAAVDLRARAMTWYMGGIAAVEAAGAGAGALLPVGSGGTVTGGLLVAVIAFHAAVLLPTILVARASPIAVSQRRPMRARLGERAGVLSGGFAVMVLGSGPAFLSVALAAELHGRAWVAAAAATFTVGALLAPLAAVVLERTQLPGLATWPILGVGMIAGWIVAPWHPAGLLLATLLSGIFMTTFEGTMDARIAADRASATDALGWAAAARALGSAAAVGSLPTLIALSSVGALSAVLCLVLAGAGLVGLAAAAVPYTLRRPAPRGLWS